MKRLVWLFLLPMAGIAGHHALRWAITQLEHIGEDTPSPTDEEDD